jgi:hypothetical protein
MKGLDTRDPSYIMTTPKRQPRHKLNSARRIGRLRIGRAKTNFVQISSSTNHLERREYGCFVVVEIIIILDFVQFMREFKFFWSNKTNYKFSKISES